MAFQTGGEIQQGFQTGGEVEPQQDTSTPLFDALGGKMPSTGQLPPRYKTVIIQREPLTGANPAFSKEVNRRKAFKSLIDQGFSKEQIDLTLKSQKMLGAVRGGRMAGGIGGAIAATAIAGRFIPGPIDDALILGTLAATGGAGLGGVAGEAIQTGLQEKRLIDQREALHAFAIEAATEAGGRGVAKLGKLAFSPFIKKAVPEAAALMDDFAKVGGHFSPTELDKRFTLRVGEAFSRGSFGAKKIFQDFEEKQGKAVLVFAGNVIDSIGEGIARQTPEEIGEVFAQGITRPGGRVFNMLDDLFDPLYKQVDELAKGTNVSTGKLKSFAQKHLATDKRLNKQFLSPAGRAKLQKVAEMGDNLSFSDMRTLRSSFLKDIRKLARDVDQSEGLIKQLAGLTDDAIFDPASAKGASKEALNLLRNTNSLYKTAQKGIKTTFSETLAKRILKNPSSVVKEVFPANNPKAIRLLRKSLVEPIAGKPNAEGKAIFNQLRQAWLADAVEQASKEGVANPKVLNKVINKLGDKGLKEMFPEPNIRGRVKKVQQLFEQAGKTPPTGASLFSRSAQVGGLAMMYSSGKEGNFVGFTAGAALALGPMAFARLATTPKGVKLLTAGFKIKPGSSQLVPNAVRMVRLLREMDQKDEKRRQKLIRAEAAARIKNVKAPKFRELRGFGGRGF